MCGSRHTFSRTETKYFVGATEIPENQLQQVPGWRFHELFPDRKDGFTKRGGAKRVALSPSDFIPIAQQKAEKVEVVRRFKQQWVEDGHISQEQANRDVAAIEREWSPMSINSFLVTKASPPQAIDRVIKWERKEKQTMCGAKCRNARGPNCDCICEGKYHGAGMTNSRTRFAASDLDFKPTAEMAANAARGLELREKHGKGGTAVGVARARDIKNRANLSPDTVKRMHSFFSRHEGNQAGGEDDAGYIAWLLWGGDAGKAWAARKAAQIDKSESARGAARKATMARQMVGSKGNKRVYIDGPDGSGKYNLYFVQVANTGVPGESPAEDLIELKQFATEARARSAAQKMLSSRPGAKAAFAANSVDLWNFLSRNDTRLTRQNENDLALHKKYAKMALSLPDFTPPSHAQHGPSLHTMAKDVLAEIKAWEEHVYRYRNRAPWEASRPGAKARFEQLQVGDAFRFEGKIYVVNSNAEEVNALLASDKRDSEKALMLAGYLYKRWLSYEGKANAARPGAKARFDRMAVANEILRQLGGGRFMAMVGGKNALATTVNGKNGLQVQIGRGAKNGINRLVVLLDEGSDTYDMQLWRIGQRGLSTTKVWEGDGLYAEDLARIFTDKTGFYTSFARPGKSAFSLAAVKSAAAKVAAAYGTGEDSAVIRKHLDRIVSVLSGNSEGGRREAMGIHAQIGSVAERTHGRDFMWSAPMQGLESAIRSAGQFSRPGAKAKFYTSPTKTGKNGPVTWDNLFVGHLGNGWTLANKGHEVSGDYERVAHIAYGGEVTFAPGFNQARLDPRVKAYIQKLSVEAAQKKSAGEPLARTGSGQGLYSRSGAKAKFSSNPFIATAVKKAQRLRLVAKDLIAALSSGNKDEARRIVSGMRYAVENIDNHIKTFMSRPGAKARFAWSISDAVEAKKMTDYFKERISRMDPGDGAFVRSVARTHLSSLMYSLDEAASGGAITRMESQEMKKSAIEAYRAKFSRSGAKAAFGNADRLDNLLAATYRALRNNDKAAARKLLSDAAKEIDSNTPVNLVADFKELKASMSRADAKSNGLTLAQRIAVAHDAKRMALR